MKAAPLSASPQDTPLLQHALYYASLGWSVVPTHRVSLLGNQHVCSCPAGAGCISKGKHPAVAWTQWQRERADETQIRAWWTGPFAAYGVGIVTGAVSGIFVVDSDEGSGKPGAETLLNLQMIHGDMPHTVQARTGGGGRHYILRHPRDIWVTTGKNVLGPGVDIRGDGGFIVAAPSMHESGRIYLWDEAAHPRTTEIAEAPAWLIEMAETPPPDATGKRAPSTGNGEIVRDAWGKVIDGRERHMIGIICGVIAGHLRDCGLLPSVDDVVTEAWPSYERTTRARGASLEEDGRGTTLMRQRAAHMLRRAASGKWKVEARPFEEGGGKAGEEPKPPPEPPILSATPLATLDLDNIPPRQWLYGRELVRGFVSVLGSPGGTGKTAYTKAVGVSIALNRPLLRAGLGAPPDHCRIHQSGPVWFWNLEDPMDELRRRIKATLMHHDVPVAEVAERIYIDSGRDKPLVITVRTPEGRIVAAPIVEPLIAELIRRGIAAFIVDPFVQSHGAEENRNEEMNTVMALWGQVAHQANCAVWLIHHFRKGGQGADAESFRGAGAIQGAARSMYTISTMTADEAKALGVPEDDRWRHIRHDNAKQNMAPRAGKATWFRLASVALGNATTDYPDGDHVQAVEAWQPPSPWDGIPWSTIERILKLIDAGPEPGEFFAAAKQSRDRWAGSVVMREAGKSDAQAASILKAWLDNGLLEEGKYASPRQKGYLTGCVRINQAKFMEVRNAAGTRTNDDDE